MSPFKPVTAPRWLVAAIVVAVPALPLAAAYVSTTLSDTADLAAQIQQSRREATLSSCAEQNDRHDQTIATLDRLLAAAVKRDPGQAARLKQSRASTVLLINALAPRRDCQKRAQRLVSIKP